MSKVPKTHILRKLNVLINQAELTGGQYTWNPPVADYSDPIGGTYCINARDDAGQYWSVIFGLVNNTEGISSASSAESSQVRVNQISIRL
jgi:hypothetical protein